MLAFLVAIAIGAPVLEIPVAGRLEAARTARRLADLGLDASVVRVVGSVRVRVDPGEAEQADSDALAGLIRDALGIGVLILGEASGGDAIVRTTGAEAFLEETLTAAPRLHFRFVREFEGSTIAHDWWSDGTTCAVAIQSSGGPATSSRLYLDAAGAWVWTEVDGRRDASAAQVREWCRQLSPSVVLADAIAIGFGRQVPPGPGCRTVGTGVMCVDADPDASGSWTLFSGGHRAAIGHWVPASIERYDRGVLEDRVHSFSIDSSSSAPDTGFDPVNH